MSGLDAASRPDWFIPADHLPAPPPPTVGAERLADRHRQRRAVIARPRDDGLPRAARGADPATGTVLCLGLDPDPAACPPGFARDLAGVERFAASSSRRPRPYAAAVKPNLAFFEAYGSAGMAALERLRATIPADVPVIADAKRGDIGSTAARQAVALFDVLGADAVTVNPYLGSEAVAPLLERPTGSPTCCAGRPTPGPASSRTSSVAADPTGGAGASRCTRGSRAGRRWGPGGTVGLVVGATAPAELAAHPGHRAGPAFLVPGVGAQGGDMEPVLADGPATASPAGAGPVAACS